VIVLDASAAIELVLRTPTGLEIETRILTPEESLHAPHLIDLEVVQVLRRYVLHEDLDADRALEALHDFTDLPLERYPHRPFAERVWELRRNLTAYDGAYVALAEVLDAPLVTVDGPLARSSGHRAQIEVVRPRP
jgi:predicted nucleic acid-binding protein